MSEEEPEGVVRSLSSYSHTWGFQRVRKGKALLDRVALVDIEFVITLYSLTG